MRIVVFGGSGFLGSHVADILTEKGHKVTIFDKRPSAYLKKNQRMVLGDILDEKAVAQTARGHHCLYNFAGIADLDDATTRPLETVRQNIVGTANLLEASRKTGVNRFIYASTTYVYSQKGGFYRCSKQAAEIYIEEYQRRFGLDFTILRYGTLYGTRADGRNSVYRYLKAAMEDGRITCDGTGEEMREYVNVRDAAALSVQILSPDFRNKHIIVTGHHPMKFKDMILMIREILGTDIKVRFTGKKSRHHYAYTPYSFAPKIGDKLVSNRYLDMGQGLLECIHEMQDYVR